VRIAINPLSGLAPACFQSGPGGTQRICLGSRTLRSAKSGRPGEAVIAVGDTGPGIEPERRERIFDAFYTTKVDGIGMGLSICRTIVNAHGGRLWADSNQPRGAVFKIAMPNIERSHWPELRQSRLLRSAFTKVGFGPPVNVRGSLPK
jgi:nitrogen-specific signal transduction histidine kinase